jgi:hypothetical protein
MLMFPEPEATMEEEWCRGQLQQIYAVHNPSKLTEIDRLLVKYAGRERILYEKACKKYGVQPAPKDSRQSPRGRPQSPEHVLEAWARANRVTLQPEHSAPSTISSNQASFGPKGYVHPELERLVPSQDGRNRSETLQKPDIGKDWAFDQAHIKDLVRQALRDVLEAKRSMSQRTAIVLGVSVLFIVVSIIVAVGSSQAAAAGNGPPRKDSAMLGHDRYGVVELTTFRTTTTTTSFQGPMVTFFTAETRGRPLLDTIGSFHTEFHQQVINVGYGKKWVNYKTKVLLLQRYLREIIDENARAILEGSDPVPLGNRLVAFIDGSDVFHGGCSQKEFMKAYYDIVRASGAKIVFSAEIVCGEQDCNKVPDVPIWASRLGGGKDLEGGFWKQYAEGCHGTWTDECAARRDCGGSAPCADPPAVKFLNSGFFIGPVAEISAMMDWTLLHYDETSVWGDQSAFAVYWLDNPDKVTLDYNGALTLQLSDLDWSLLEVDKSRGIIWNQGFQRVQCLIHGNGRGIYYMKHLLEDLTNSTLKKLRNW